MIPKLASNLLHFNVQRVAAAVQTQTTQTLRNVLQFQPQAQAQSVASSTTSTSLSWNAANGAAGTGAGPGGAKFNAGGRFYNAFQVSRFLWFSGHHELDNRDTYPDLRRLLHLRCSADLV